LESIRVTKVNTFIIGGAWRNWVVVKIETDEGVYGIGEATLEGKAKSVEAAVGELTRYLVGKDVSNIEKHFQEMYRRAYYAGGAVLNSAISGVETALWDIKGKVLGVPIYDLIGGKTRDRIRIYANGWYSAGMSPNEFAAAAKRVTSLGAKGLKFNPWSRRPGIDFYRMENSILHAGVESVAAVREVVGPDIDLFIDCNGIFNTTGVAVTAAKAIEEFNIGFIEEPVLHENFDQMAYFRGKVNIPVATGERLFTPFAFQQLLERGGADIVQPDLSHCGGILSALKIAAIADSHYAAFAPHNANGEISYAAAIQMAATVPNFFAFEYFPAEPWRYEVCRNDLILADGWIEVPDRPGLGIEFNEEAALEHPYEPVDLYDLHRPAEAIKVPEFGDALR